MERRSYCHKDAGCHDWLLICVLCQFICTICPRSSYPFYIVTYFEKMGHYFLDHLAPNPRPWTILLQTPDPGPSYSKPRALDHLAPNSGPWTILLQTPDPGPSYSKPRALDHLTPNPGPWTILLQTPVPGPSCSKPRALDNLDPNPGPWTILRHRRAVSLPL